MKFVSFLLILSLSLCLANAAKEEQPTGWLSFLGNKLGLSNDKPIVPPKQEEAEEDADDEDENEPLPEAKMMDRGFEIDVDELDGARRERKISTSVIENPSANVNIRVGYRPTPDNVGLRPLDPNQYRYNQNGGSVSHAQNMGYYGMGQQMTPGFVDNYGRCMCECNRASQLHANSYYGQQNSMYGNGYGSVVSEQMHRPNQAGNYQQQYMYQNNPESHMAYQSSNYQTYPTNNVNQLSSSSSSRQVASNQLKPLPNLAAQNKAAEAEENSWVMSSTSPSTGSSLTSFANRQESSSYGSSQKTNEPRKPLLAPAIEPLKVDYLSGASLVPDRSTVSHTDELKLAPISVGSQEASSTSSGLGHGVGSSGVYSSSGSSLGSHGSSLKPSIPELKPLSVGSGFDHSLNIDSVVDKTIDKLNRQNHFDDDGPSVLNKVLAQGDNLRATNPMSVPVARHHKSARKEETSSPSSSGPYIAPLYNLPITQQSTFSAPFDSNGNFVGMHHD